MKKSMLIFLAILFLLSGCAPNITDENKPPQNSGTSSQQSVGSSTNSSNNNQASDPQRASKDPKDEAQMAEDINGNKFFKEQYSRFTVSEVTVDKRQTDTANKTDKVYVTAHVINSNENLPRHQPNTIEGNVNLILTYGLYNEGWIFDTFEVDFNGEFGSGQYKAIADIELDEGQIKNFLGIGDSTYLEILDHTTDEEVGKFVTYSIKTIDNYKYANVTLETCLQFIFNGDTEYSSGEWVSNISSSELEYDWHLSGEYPTFDDSKSVNLPYDQPEEMMEYAQSSTYDGGSYTLRTSFRDITSTTLKEFGASLDCGEEISQGYAVRFWDGENRDAYVGMDYNDFCYGYVGQVVYNLYREYSFVFLIGPDKIASVNPEGTVDPINHIVYFEIKEVFPAE